MSGNWRDAFEERGQRHAPSINTGRSPAEPDDIALVHDLTIYRPWTLQRGRSRPAMMLELRRYEPRSGLWTGWQLSYPTLLAIEYTGDRLISLDFGSRQFVIEGRGLDELARHLQQGSVMAIQEYAPVLWPARPEGGVISAIRKIATCGQFKV